MVSYRDLKIGADLGSKAIEHFSFGAKSNPINKIKFGTISKPLEQVTPKANFGTSVSATVEQVTREMTGATQLAEQNRAAILNNRQTSSKFNFGRATKINNFIAEPILYNRNGAKVTLTYRKGTESLEFSPDVLKGIQGYTDSNGIVLPYIFLDSLEITNKGNGLGRVVLEDIKQMARDRCGGRLLLCPSNEYRNPSPFYYKCGLRSTTKEGTDEILAYLNNGTPFKSGSSSPMYLPIE